MTPGPHCFGEISFYVKSMELMTPECSQFGHKGHDKHDLYRVPLNIATHEI